MSCISSATSGARRLGLHEAPPQAPVRFEGKVNIPEGFEEAWNELMDLEVSFVCSSPTTDDPMRIATETHLVREWCRFEVDVDHPECILKLLDPCEENFTLGALRSGDNSVFIEVLTIACSMLGIPSIVVQCSDSGNIDEAKMNLFGDGFRAALKNQDPDSRVLDGVKKSWDAIDWDRFVVGKHTLVVPGSLAALEGTADYLERSGVRPVVIVDEREMMYKTEFAAGCVGPLRRAYETLFGLSRCPVLTSGLGE